MINISITGEFTGSKAMMFEFPNQEGRRKSVPTYRASAYCSRTGERFEFPVIRYSSAQVFGKPLAGQYGEGGECPPCMGLPYQGLVREDGTRGFRIQLYETKLGTDSLIGIGSVVRKHIQIHFGAAASNGCIMVAGPRSLYGKTFERPMRRMLKSSDVINVFVSPR